jgi:hypothetical protein
MIKEFLFNGCLVFIRFEIFGEEDQDEASSLIKQFIEWTTSVY